MTHATRIGLISDTHGLLRPEAAKALRGSDLILHAGDIGAPEILERLGELAPVIAIRGNIDTAAWAARLPETATVETRAARIFMIHNVRDLQCTGGHAIILSGHSHKPGHTVREGVHFINPGSAGPRRFKLPIAVARLDLRATPWTVEFIELV